MNMFKKFFGSIAVALLVSTTAGYATVYDIDRENGGSVFKDVNGENAWWVAVNRDVHLNGAHKDGVVAAGMFRVVEDLAGPVDRHFLAFCLSPEIWLNLNVDYSKGTGLARGVLGALGALRRNAFDMINDSVSAGAFQIAVWEIVSDHGNLDLTAGNIKYASNNPNAANAIALADSWLAKIENGSWASSYGGMRFHKARGSSQDLIEIAPIPLPASGLLMIGGLALAGFVRRKK